MRFAISKLEGYHNPKLQQFRLLLYREKVDYAGYYYFLDSWHLVMCRLFNVHPAGMIVTTSATIAENADTAVIAVQTPIQLTRLVAKETARLASMNRVLCHASE
jgi:hypothetical protein